MSTTPPRPREQRELTIQVGKGSSKTRDESAAAEAAESKVGQLFDRLGGKGKVKVFRVVDGDENYARTLDVDEDLADNLEETLAKQCGGGTYVLKGFHRVVGVGVKCVGIATIRIDEVVHPPRQTAREKERDGDASQKPNEATKELLGLVKEQAKQTREDADSRERSSSAMFTQSMQLQIEQTRAQAQVQIAASQAQAASQMQMMTMMISLATGQKGAAPGGIEQLEIARKFFEGVGFKQGGGGEGKEDTRSFGERLIENPLSRIADKVGDRVGEKVAQMFVDEQKANAPQAAPAPLQLQPAAQPAPPAASAPPKPAPGAPHKLPPGARLLTDQELKAMKARGLQQRAAPPPPPAPSAAAVLPSEK